MSKPVMKVFHDWEFEERHGFIDVISAGFVREDGRELYIVFNDFDTLSVARNGWLMDNVMPSIGHREITSHVTGTGQPVKDLVITDEAALTKNQARQLILDFVYDIRPEWWAWYGAYDHVALCSVFGRMIDLPDGWPMMTMDLKQMHKAAGMPHMPRQPQGLHNALEDARFNVERYKYLERVLRGKTVLIASPILTSMDVNHWMKENHDDVNANDVVVIRDPNELRGLTFSKNRDKIVWLVPETEDMKFALDLSFRKP